MATTSLAVLKITLDEVEPRVTRRIAVPSDLRLDRLHLVIQAAMGWTNSHLHMFRIGGVEWGELDPDGVFDDPMDARKGRLDRVLADAGRKTFNYVYDFGDNWSHTVRLEKIAPHVAGAPAYILLDAQGRCPPEDCGGPPGYAQLLEILSDPDHEDYEDMVMWAGGRIDPADPERDVLELNLARLERRWAPRKPKT